MADWVHCECTNSRMQSVRPREKECESVRQVQIPSSERNGERSESQGSQVQREEIDGEWQWRRAPTTEPHSHRTRGSVSTRIRLSWPPRTPQDRIGHPESAKSHPGSGWSHWFIPDRCTDFPRPGNSPETYQQVSIPLVIMCLSHEWALLRNTCPQGFHALWTKTWKFLWLNCTAGPSIVCWDTQTTKKSLWLIDITLFSY